MITITKWALIALLLTGFLSVDLVLSGLLFTLKVPFRRRFGLSLTATGVLSATVPLAILSRYAHVDTGVYLAVILSAVLIYGIRKPKKRHSCEGRDYVRAILALLREKSVDRVSFTPAPDCRDTGEDGMPWCRRFGRAIDFVCLTELSEDLLVIGVSFDDKFDVSSLFSGTENEDFGSLFRLVYDRLREPGKDPEADEWYRAFLADS